jgi:penicillin-binding protein 2
LEENARDHAWFIAYAPVENPKIAVAVLVEHGGHGGSAAAPIARRVIEEYLKNAESKMVH